MLTWDINVVALPLNEACWLGGYGGPNPDFIGRAYRSAIAQYVQRLQHFGIYVVLRLSGSTPGTTLTAQIRRVVMRRQWRTLITR